MWLCYGAGAPALMPGRKSKGCWHGAQWKGTDDGLAAVVLESWVGAPAAGAYSRNDAATHRTRWTVPLLQRPENQVRSVRGHVQVPCTGLLAGAPHTSKGQGDGGHYGGSSSDVTVLDDDDAVESRPRTSLGRRKDRLCSASFRLRSLRGEWSCQCAAEQFCAMEHQLPQSASGHRASSLGTRAMLRIEMLIVASDS